MTSNININNEIKIKIFKEKQFQEADYGYQTIIQLGIASIKYIWRKQKLNHFRTTKSRFFLILKSQKIVQNTLVNCAQFIIIF